MTTSASAVTARSVLGRMGPRFARYRWQVGGAALMSMVRIALGVAGPLLLRHVIDTALPERDARLLAVLCGAMIAAGLLGSVLTVANTALTNWVGQRVIADLRAETYDHARSQPLSFYSEHGPSEIQARLVNDVEGVDRFVTITVQDAIAQVVGICAAAVAMLILSWPLALASFVLALLLGVLNSRFARLRRQLALERQGRLTDLLRFVAETLALPGVVLGRTLCRTATTRRRFVEQCVRLRDLTFRQRVVGALAYTLIGAFFAGIPPVIYWISGTVISGVSVGAVVVLVLLQMRLSDPIERLLQHSASFQASLAMFERIHTYLDLPAQVGDAVEKEVGGVPAALCTSGLGYAYPGSTRTVPSDAHMTFPSGSTTLVTGHSGSGKTTLGLLLAGLVPPSAGSITVDGVPAPPERLREVVTLVPQQTTLLDASVLENLRLARDDATAAEIDHAVDIAGFGDVVRSLPDGYLTPVGHDGFQLSGGERQRLGIARALLAPSRVLILDEATSALDEPSAARVHEALRTHCRDRTLIVIAHRIPRLDPADQVVVVEHGSVVEAGTYADVGASLDSRLVTPGLRHTPAPAVAQPSIDGGHRP